MDFDFYTDGSIGLLTPLTPAAHDWADEHLPEDRMLWGKHSIVVEPRYVGAILEGIAEDGLTVRV
jgi:hypothetical protein